MLSANFEVTPTGDIFDAFERFVSFAKHIQLVDFNVRCRVLLDQKLNSKYQMKIIFLIRYDWPA